jgi:PAS domain S-box-containing protein/putative nucleotidyltransferase with HDIG domain
MAAKLKVLIVEDSAADTELALHELRHFGYDPEWTRIETEPEFLAQIDQGWEIILSDYNLPEFSGFRALELLRERDPDLPFIIVSGTIGEDKAVATMKAGANDYIIKDRMARLGPAVERELRDAGARRDRKRAEEALKESESKYRLLADNARDIIFVLDMNLNYTYISPSVKILRGYGPEELLRRPALETLMPASADIARRIVSEIMELEKSECRDVPISRALQLEMRKKDGNTVWTEVKFSFFRDENQRLAGLLGVTRDITERKQEFERMKKALAATVQSIAVIVETKDPYTAGHQRRVAGLARAIAAEMNLPADQVDGIRTAAAIHDIGKISVPAEILSKPTKLTAIEFSLIKTHSQCGYEILKDIEFPWPVARMVLEHHERMDGSGYPHGLRGDHVLMDSRILAVADVVEAMASYRPYRPSLGIDAALNEISMNKGRLYDTDVAEACLRLFHEQGYQIID